MNSGTHGTKNEKGEYLDAMVKRIDTKTEEESYLLKLLALVSDKINERFLNLQTCFRFLDTDKSQSLSLNEFA
jgi:NAD+--asparagine ADP-ribosyltransferase